VPSETLFAKHQFVVFFPEVHVEQDMLKSNCPLTCSTQIVGGLPVSLFVPLDNLTESLDLVDSVLNRIPFYRNLVRIFAQNCLDCVERMGNGLVSNDLHAAILKI
jgi:hypothetical protein